MEEIVLAALYRVNKEAKRLRDLRAELKNVLFEFREPSTELCKYVVDCGLTFHSADPEEVDYITSKPLETRKKEMEELIHNYDFDDEVIEEMEFALDLDEAMLSKLHGLLLTMRNEKEKLYELKSKVLDAMDLPLTGFHFITVGNGADSYKEILALHSCGKYSFHSFVDEDEGSIPQHLFLTNEPLPEITSNVNEELSQNLSLEESISILMRKLD